MAYLLFIYLKIISKKMEKMEGTVKFYNEAKKFGFVILDGKELYFNNFPCNKGDKVIVTICQSHRGEMAMVSVIKVVFGNFLIAENEDGESVYYNCFAIRSIHFFNGIFEVIMRGDSFKTSKIPLEVLAKFPNIQKQYIAYNEAEEFFKKNALAASKIQNLLKNPLIIAEKEDRSSGYYDSESVSPFFKDGVMSFEKIHSHFFPKNAIKIYEKYGDCVEMKNIIEKLGELINDPELIYCEGGWQSGIGQDHIGFFCKKSDLKENPKFLLI